MRLGEAMLTKLMAYNNNTLMTTSHTTLIRVSIRMGSSTVLILLVPKLLILLPKCLCYRVLTPTLRILRWRRVICRAPHALIGLASRRRARNLASRN